jgi:hypothetical protein
VERVDDDVDAVEAASPTSDAPPDPDPSAESPEATEATRDPAARERSREAASYRVRLREAEDQLGQRDDVIGGLRAEIDRMHRAEAERLATDLQTPADLWMAASLDDMRDDDGRLDHERVKAKVADVLAAHPAWRARSVSFDGGARRTPDMARKPGLADLLKGGG